jgi:hypothetical protein
VTVQRKTIAKGSILGIGPAGGSISEFGRVINFTPPTQDRETVEAPELNPQDDSGTALDGDPMELADEILGEETFEMYWDPRHVDATTIDGWWANKTELTFQFDTPHATDAARLSFNGKIKTLSPQQVTKRDYFRRTITVIRTSAVTNAAKP